MTTRCTYKFAHEDRGQCVLPDEHDGYHEDWSNREAEIQRLRALVHDSCNEWRCTYCGVLITEYQPGPTGPGGEMPCGPCFRGESR